jgi:hypothetical protein
MKHPIFHVGEECYLRDSATIPHLSGRQCRVTGVRTRRAIYNDFGEITGYMESYKVLPEGHHDEVCAPERMLRKKWERSDWGMLRGIFQPKREAR